jgi:hypothetical protein
MTTCQRSEMFTVTIDRAKWGKHFLRREVNGKMCCLGFIAKKCGFEDEDLSDSPMPGDIGRNAPKNQKLWNKLVTTSSSLEVNSGLACDAASINDDNTTFSRKEPLLRKLFKEHGISLRFVGEK